MSFTDITDRLANILEDRVATLTSGLDEQQIAIESAFPHEHYAPQVIFIHRANLPDISPGQLIGHGTDVGGEIDGVGTWEINIYVRFPGNEEAAAEELSKLTWNLIKTLAGYAAQGETDWVSMLPTSSNPTTLGGVESGWYLGETMSIQVRWEMIL